MDINLSKIENKFLPFFRKNIFRIIDVLLFLIFFIAILFVAIYLYRVVFQEEKIDETQIGLQEVKVDTSLYNEVLTRLDDRKVGDLSDIDKLKDPFGAIEEE